MQKGSTSKTRVAGTPSVAGIGERGKAPKEGERGFIPKKSEVKKIRIHDFTLLNTNYLTKASTRWNDQESKPIKH